MEARHVEVQRFARKAAAYKKALEIAPYARGIEVSVVVSMALGVCRRKGWEPAQVRVVDLMAGTGFLSVALKAAGFKDIKAIEACAEMLPDGDPGIEFLDDAAFINLRNSLEKIRPQMIISLAGFHHLIDRRGKGIDRAQSICTQTAVGGICVDSLAPDGILLIVDISEDDEFSQLGIDIITDWDGAAFGFIKCGQKQLQSALLPTTTLESYEEAIKHQYGTLSLDGTLKWFREFVDPHTSVGHDDVAISRQLLQLLKWKYGTAVKFTRFRCPWVFEAREQAIEFTLQKFGFYVDRTAAEVNKGTVEKGLEQHLGLREYDDGTCTLSWSLGAWMLDGVGRLRVNSTIPLANLCLFTTSLIMFSRTLIRHVAGANTNVDSVLSTTYWIIIGLLVGVLWDSVKSGFTDRA